MAKTDGPTRNIAGACLALLVFACVGCNAAWPTPDECHDGLVLTSCGSNDPDFFNCFRKALKKDMLILKDGHNKLGLDSLDPLLVKEMVLSLPLKQTMRLSNLVVTGLSKVTVESLQGVPSPTTATTISFLFNIPDLEIKSSYVLQGLWGIPESLGLASINIRNYTTSLELDLLPQKEDDGKVYATYTKSRSKFLDADYVDVVLTGITGRRIKLDLTSDVARAAFQESIAQKQAEINYAYTIRLYQFAPPMDIWFDPNITGPHQVCLHPHHRVGASCVDIIGRGF